MRHRKKFNHLSRTSAHRRAMLSNMATSLILHKRITTTVAKAKALRIYVEPLITRSKNDTTHSRRVVFSHLKSKEAVTELFRDVSVKVAERPGGYTRIIKLGLREGDNADMCMMELVDYNENLLGGGKTDDKTTGRRRRRKKVVTQTTAPKAKADDKKSQPKADTEKPVTVAKEVEKPASEAPVEEVEETKAIPADVQPEEVEDATELTEEQQVAPEQEADTDEESTKKK
jgi:large subunit ribosomal protein L17